LRAVSESDKRAQRVGVLIQHELANVITNEMKDPRVGFVTVTEVRVTGDLRGAKVFVSVLGPPEQRAASLEGLRAAAGYFKHVLASRVDLRWVPDLEFEADETLDKAERLETLMQAIARGDTDAPPAEALPPMAAHTDRSDLADKRKSFEEQRKRPAGGETPQRPHSRSRRRPRR
jgi:ribosome-binding factor A